MVRCFLRKRKPKSVIPARYAAIITRSSRFNPNPRFLLTQEPTVEARLSAFQPSALNCRALYRHVPRLKSARTCVRTTAMAFYLGIDGGGTKTRCILGNETAVLATAVSGGCNIVRLGEAQARESLHAV